MDMDTWSFEGDRMNFDNDLSACAGKTSHGCCRVIGGGFSGSSCDEQSMSDSQIDTTTYDICSLVV